MKRLGLFMTVIMILCITVNAQKQSNRTLVAYFSATGTTEKAAKQIAEVTGGALYEIQPAKKYTSTDLDWHDKSSRSSVEMQMPRHVPHCVPSPKTWQPMIPSISVSPFGGTWLQESSTVL